MVLKTIEPFILGGVASCTAEFFTFPIDLVKTKLQIQGQNIEQSVNNPIKSLKYNGMINCFTVIVQKEGIKSLYYGIKPALLRQASYGTLKLGFYQYLKKKFSHSQEQKLAYNILFACVSGASASAICTPTDVLKVRMQTSQYEFHNKGVIYSFNDIYKKEGIRGLYRGILPNAQRAAVIAVAELSTYDSFKQFLINDLSFEDNSISHFISSSVSGFCAATASTPIDVVKTRIMNQRKLKDNTNIKKIYKGSIDCLAKTIRYEGLFALYKGFLPTYLRLGPWNILFFMTYENCKYFFPRN